jgi:GH24 family phage-related lysozyme (muramidase)
MNVQPDYDLLFKLISNFEGFENSAYLDSGKVPTIGIGSTYNFDKKRKVKMGDYITKETATRWLELHCEEFVKQANLYIKTPLNPHQSAAVVDNIYNRGIGNFLRTNLDELINGNPNSAAIKDEFLGTGLKDRAGNLLWGLGRRRRAEWWLYSTGKLKFDFPRWGKI